VQETTGDTEKTNVTVQAMKA